MDDPLHDDYLGVRQMAAGSGPFTTALLVSARGLWELATVEMRWGDFRGPGMNWRKLLNKRLMVAFTDFMEWCRQQQHRHSMAPWKYSSISKFTAAAWPRLKSKGHEAVFHLTLVICAQ